MKSHPGLQKKKKERYQQKVALCSDTHPCTSLQGQRQEDCPQVPARPGKSLINNNYKLGGKKEYELSFIRFELFS